MIYIYLVRICENPGIIQERVADLLKVDRSTASRAIEEREILLELLIRIRKNVEPQWESVKRGGKRPYSRG